MDLARKIEVLNKQILDANDGFPHDFERWKTATEVALRTVMGEGSQQHRAFNSNSYRSRVISPDIPNNATGHRIAGVKRAIAILESAKQELQLRAEFEDVIETDETEQERENAADHGRVFIVHGHDGAAKHELARLLRELTGTEPIILHEKPNSGLTVIEKFEEYASSARFAVALLTADDLGRAKGADSDSPRARQNVVFEAGYFAGLLGRARVVLLHEEGVELPSDLAGIVFVPLDSAGGWKTTVAREMDAQGLEVEWKALRGV